METISKPAKVTSKALVAPWFKATSMAMAQLAKPPHNQKDTKASAKMEHLKKSLENTAVALNLHEVNLPSAPHLNSATPELKKLHKDPSHVSASKTTLRGNASKVGLNQLMIVSWEGRQQVYCLLCSTRLKSSSHSSSYNHCLNYVKIKFPGWNTAPSELESKLSNIVAHLAEVERDVGFQSPQRVEVTKEVYKKLATLAEDKAIEMVKAVLIQKDPRVSSFKAQTAEALRWEAASPCQVSSSADGVSVVDNISGFYNQTQQEHKLDETLQIQSTGKDSVVKLWSVKGQSSNEDQSDMVQGQLQASVCDKVQPDLVPGSQAEETKETVQQYKFEPDVEVHSMSEIAHGNESSDTKDLKTPSDAEHSRTPVRQHWISDSVSQVPQKGLESPQKPVQICSPQLQTTASVATEQQKPSGSSLSTEQGTGFGEPSSSPAQPTTVFGIKLKGCSRLSIFLKVDQSLKSVIGMAFVWECRGLSQKTFYLCESCRETLTHRDICRHMVSLSHQLKHLWKVHPEFLQMFWLKEDLPPELKMDILNDVVSELAARECFHKVDAQCVLLGHELYWLVRTAHFSEALKVMKNINEKQIAFCRPVTSAQQNGQQNDCPSVEKPHPTEGLLAPVLNIKPTSDFESKPDVKKKSMEEDLHVVRKRVSSPNVNSSSVKNDPGASPIPIVPSHRYPHKTSSGSSPQPTLSSNLSQLQSSDLPSQVQPLSESTSTISSTVSQNVEVSLTKKVPLKRKRSEESSPQSLLQTCTSTPLKHHLPASTPSHVESEPKSPSAAVNSENPTPLPLKNKTSGPKQISPIVDRTLFAELNMNSEINFLSKSTPAYSKTSNSYASISSESGQNRLGSKIVFIKSPSAFLKRRWDSKCQLAKAMVKKSTTINSTKRIKTKASLDMEKKLLTPCVSSACSANISREQLEGNCPAPSAKDTVSTFTADPKDPRDLHSLRVLDGFQNVSIFKSSCARPGQLPQSSSEPNRSGRSPLPMSTIITARPNPVKLYVPGQL